LLLDQLDRLAADIASQREKNPETYQATASAKVLAAVLKLIKVVIPEDPARQEYRQGNTLGENRKHWFRAKFGGQRYRLFFRFNSKAKIILFAWVNDSGTLRAYGDKNDAYAVFRSMLEGGHPPDEWESLLKECGQDGPRKRIAAVLGSDPDVGR